MPQILTNLPALLAEQGLITRFESCTTDKSIQFAAEQHHISRIFKENEKLAECTPDSVKTALLNVAFTGLSLDPTQKQAYLIAYGKECQFMPSYRGMLHLVFKAGTIKDVQPVLVYEGDTFEVATVNGERTVNHVEVATDRSPAKIIACYLITNFTNGGRHIQVSRKSDLEAFQKAATHKPNGQPKKGTAGMVWKGAWKGEMCIKSTIRRAEKYWPKDPEGFLAHASAVMEMFDPADPNYTYADPEDVTPVDEEGEPVLLMSEEDVLTIHAALTEGMDGVEGLSPEDASTWINMKAQGEGYNSIEHAPAERKDEFKNALLERLMVYRQKHQGAQNANS